MKKLLISIDQFLFQTRSGFCSHYASASAMLLRAAGVPARVVGGYQGGDWQASQQYLIVRQRDAHAWVEYLQDGYWHLFDPTAAIAPEPGRFRRGPGPRPRGRVCGRRGPILPVCVQTRSG